MKSKILNRLNIASDILNKRSEVKGLPVEYVLEVSSRCNLRCKMCPIGSVTRATGFMEPDVFEIIVNKIAPYAELIYLIGLGEPLYNIHFLDYLAELRSRNISVGTSTNCTLLTSNISENLLKNDLSYIIMPLDGIEKWTYESIRVNANFELVIENIKQFLYLKKKLKKKTFVQIQMIQMEENKEESRHFKDFVAKLDIHHQVNDVRLKPLINFNEPDRLASQEKVYNACYLLWRNMFINHQGVAHVCCQDIDGSTTIGDFKTESLEEIWQSNKIQSFRKMHIEKEMYRIELCSTCDLNRNYFTPLSLLGAALFDATTLKKYISYYERYNRKLGVYGD